MSRWWRAYDEAIDDPKLQQLPAALFRAWFNLCCLTSRNGGTLPEIGVIAFKLRCTESKASEVIGQLQEAHLIDDVDNGDGTTYAAPHNWSGRQFQSDTSTARVKRFRSKPRNVSSAVSVAAPETEEQILETDSEKKERKNARERASPDFDAFWDKYPEKVGRKAAIKAFEKARKSENITIESLLSALDRYCNKTDDRPWCNPATWLNQGRWDDRPAEVKPNGKLTVHQAAANLLERVRALDEPAPSDLCDGASEYPIRRLSSG